MSHTQSTHSSDRSVAVVHGNYFIARGGEHVAEHIAKAFDAPLYYGFGDDSVVPDNDVDHHQLFTGLANRLLGRKGAAMPRDAYYMHAFKHVPELHDYDVVIQSGNEPGWYIPPDDQVVVTYRHSTPRNAYDQYPERAGDRGILFEAYTELTRTLYRKNVEFTDLHVANSELIQRRLDRYWGVASGESCTVYPPVPVSDLGPGHATDTAIDGEYYLVLDGLVPMKHVDKIIAAFRRHRDKRLVIAGSGPERDALEAQASDLSNASFRGYVPEAEKRALLAGAEALVYAAANEDFGMVPIEALASGTPVIAPRDGYQRMQIDDGRTGILYDDRRDIDAAIERFTSEGVDATTADLVAEADQYGVERFNEEMHAAVALAVKRRDRTLSRSGEPATMAEATTTKQPTMPDGGEE